MVTRSPPPKNRFETSKRGVLRGVAAASTLLLAGCQTLQSGLSDGDPCSNDARNIGIVAGSALGALIGHAIKDNKEGLLIGAGVGAVAGGLIGHSMDVRRCELHRISQRHRVQMQVTNVELSRQGSTADARQGLLVSMRDTGEQFASGSTRPSRQGAALFADIARSYRQPLEGETAAATRARLNQMRILLVGHTDDTGSTAANADLSQARAQAVAQIFAQHGFNRDQIYYQGAGETLPIADNATAEGRAQNRRVEIIDLSNDEALSVYLQSRQTNTAFYRAKPAQQASDEQPTTTNTSRTSSKKSPARQERVRTSGPATSTREDRPTAAATGSESLAKVPVVKRPESVTPTSPNPVPAATAARQGSVAELDFGGSRIANNRATVVSIGEPRGSSGGFSLFSQAHASADTPLGSCLNDRPRASHGVKSLKTGKLRTTDYMPGVYNSSWVDSVNGHLVALNKVAVLRDEALPAHQPELLIYANYQSGSRAKPTWRGTPQVNTYNGNKALLYRVFVDGPMQCMDIVIPHSNPSKAEGSNLIYTRHGDYYQTGFSPKLVKK